MHRKWKKTHGLEERLKGSKRVTLCSLLNAADWLTGSQCRLSGNDPAVPGQYACG